MVVCFRVRPAIAGRPIRGAPRLLFLDSWVDSCEVWIKQEYKIDGWIFQLCETFHLHRPIFIHIQISDMECVIFTVLEAN